MFLGGVVRVGASRLNDDSLVRVVRKHRTPSGEHVIVLESPAGKTLGPVALSRSAWEHYQVGDFLEADVTALGRVRSVHVRYQQARTE